MTRGARWTIIVDMRYVFGRITIAVLLAAVLAAAPGSAKLSSGPAQRFAQALTDYEAGSYDTASAGALETAGLFPGTDWEGRALFLAGRSDAARGELERAAREFGLSKEKYRVLEDYADYILAGAYRDAGMAGKAAGIYLDIADRRPYGVLSGDSLLEAGRLFVSDKKLDDAVMPLQLLLSKGPRREQSAEALYLLARARADKGDADAVFEYYRKLWLEYPDFPFVEIAAELARGLATAEKPLLLPDADDYLARADRFSGLGIYGQAGRHYEKALGMLPYESPKRGEALLGLGLSSYRTRDYTAAISTLGRLVEGGHSPTLAPEAYYWLVRAYLRDGQDENFRAAARRCASEFPGDRRSADCLYLLGVDYANGKMFDESVDVLSGLVGDYPYYDGLPDALWRLGWAQFMNGDYDGAEKTFKKVYERYPSTSAAAPAIYWRARALVDARRDEEASDLFGELSGGYQLSYYGLLSNSPGRPIKMDGTSGNALKPDVRLSGGQHSGDAIRRAYELGIQGMRGFGVRELRKAEGRYSSRPGSLDELAAAYYGLDEYRRPLDLASHLYRTRMDTGRSPIPKDMMRLIFPTGYWDYIEKEAETFGVNPYLVASLVREESHFDPGARSSAGAVGLMQLMPETAAMVCRRLGRPEPTDEGLRQADYNLPLGVCHLAYLLEKHDGRLAYALAEYNAGPTALTRWKNRWPDVSDDVFVENISYPETRNYVKRVLRNYYVYRELYGGG